MDKEVEKEEVTSSRGRVIRTCSGIGVRLGIGARLGIGVRPGIRVRSKATDLQ